MTAVVPQLETSIQTKFQSAAEFVHAVGVTALATLGVAMNSIVESGVDILITSIPLASGIFMAALGLIKNRFIGTNDQMETASGDLDAFWLNHTVEGQKLARTMERMREKYLKLREDVSHSNLGDPRNVRLEVPKSGLRRNDIAVEAFSPNLGSSPIRTLEVRVSDAGRKGKLVEASYDGNGKVVDIQISDIIPQQTLSKENPNNRIFGSSIYEKAYLLSQTPANLWGALNLFLLRKRLEALTA